MPHRTTTHRHARKAAAAMLVAVAALGLTACQDGTGASPSSTSKAAQGSADDAPSGIPKKSDQSCTDQIDYTGDSRSNAEINTIGEETGTCPSPEKSGKPSGTLKEPGVSCTDQINYAGDSRSNAEINTIGDDTGYCPPVQK